MGCDSPLVYHYDDVHLNDTIYSLYLSLHEAFIISELIMRRQYNGNTREQEDDV